MKYFLFFIFSIQFLFAEKVPIEVFEKSSEFKKEDIKKCIEYSSEVHDVPVEVIETIIGIENSQYLGHSINCNSFPRKYTSDVKTNYNRMQRCNNNIDIGVMQVNYLVWKKEYPNITKELLLQPCVNIELGTRILKSHFRETKDWIKSMGYYHSRTPKHFKKYVRLVKKSYGK